MINFYLKLLLFFENLYYTHCPHCQEITIDNHCDYCDY